MRSLFEKFRKEVLALDPCVGEEILKLYVAYKAETNFVDVVPQQSRLRLSRNMHFHELHDPKGLAKDVTNLGRWGNGDVEVGLSEAEEMPYIMDLVRQAFEKQMGNGGGPKRDRRPHALHDEKLRRAVTEGGAEAGPSRLGRHDRGERISHGGVLASHRRHPRRKPDRRSGDSADDPGSLPSR